MNVGKWCNQTLKGAAERKGMVGFNMALLTLEEVEKAMEEENKKNACGCWETRIL